MLRARQCNRSALRRVYHVRYCRSSIKTFSVPLREYAYNAEIDVINPIANTVGNATFGNNAEADWYIKADDIALKHNATTPTSQPTQPHKDKRE